MRGQALGVRAQGLGVQARTHRDVFRHAHKVSLSLPPFLPSFLPPSHARTHAHTLSLIHSLLSLLSFLSLSALSLSRSLSHTHSLSAHTRTQDLSEALVKTAIEVLFKPLDGRTQVMKLSLQFEQLVL
jgi:hypothetical protein